MVASTFGAGQVAYSLLWFFLFFVEIWLMVTVFIDIFRSHDLKGWQKALWIIFVLVLPLIGILAYLIARGDQMRAHNAQWLNSSQAGMSAGQGGGQAGVTAQGQSPEPHEVVDALHKLGQMRDRGDITEDQYRKLRDQLLGPDAGKDDVDASSASAGSAGSAGSGG
jgi:hypothetical protein